MFERILERRFGDGNGEELKADDFDLSDTFGYEYLPISLQDPSESDGIRYSKFTQCLHEYLRRNLLYDSDALNAFTAVSNIVASGLSTPMISGLPVAFFDLTLLCWNGTMRGFPSWSWAGWCGRMGASP